MFHDVYIISKLFLTIFYCLCVRTFFFWLGIFNLFLVIFECWSTCSEVEPQIFSFILRCIATITTIPSFAFAPLMLTLVWVELPLFLHLLFMRDPLFFVELSLFITVLHKDILVLLQVYLDLLLYVEFITLFPFLIGSILSEEVIAGKGLFSILDHERESDLVVLLLVTSMIEALYLGGFEVSNFVHHLQIDFADRDILL